MSMWADARIRELLRDVEELQAKVFALESCRDAPDTEIVFPDAIDKRTREYKNRKAA